MLSLKEATLDELAVLDLALTTANIEHSDLDIPLLEYMKDQVKEEISMRGDK